MTETEIRRFGRTSYVLYDLKYILNWKAPIYQNFLAGDFMYFQADIRKIKEKLLFYVEHHIDVGIKKAIQWYIGYYSK